MPIQLENMGGFNFPDIGRTDLSGLNLNPNYQNMMEILKRSGQAPGLAQALGPSMEALLSPAGQAASPYAAAIQRQTEQNVAQAQTGAMKRGITGSSIEATAMNQAQESGQIALAQLYGQTANQLSEMIYRAASGDLQNNRELLYVLAQAMGQEITSERDMRMFQEALRSSIDQANQFAATRKRTAWGGAAGAGMGALIGGFVPGGGLLAAGLGASVGGSLGSAAGS